MRRRIFVVSGDDLSDISLLEPSLSTNQVGTGGANVFRRGVVSPQSTGVEEWDALTPRFVASYDLAPQTLLYVSASRGFKSGGFNSVGNEPAVDPEFLWSYEAGLKSRVMNDRLQMELTAFFYDYSDLQVRKNGARSIRCC